jgi:hypothetical protein
MAVNYRSGDKVICIDAATRDNTLVRNGRYLCVELDDGEAQITTLDGIRVISPYGYWAASRFVKDNNPLPEFCVGSIR